MDSAKNAQITHSPQIYLQLLKNNKREDRSQSNVLQLSVASFQNHLN